MRAFQVSPRLSGLHSLQRAIVAAAITLTLTSLSACGQTGALFLPETESATNADGTAVEPQGVGDADREDDTP